MQDCSWEWSSLVKVSTYLLPLLTESLRTVDSCGMKHQCFAWLSLVIFGYHFYHWVSLLGYRLYVVVVSAFIQVPVSAWRPRLVGGP